MSVGRRSLQAGRIYNPVSALWGVQYDIMGWSNSSLNAVTSHKPRKATNEFE